MAAIKIADRNWQGEPSLKKAADNIRDQEGLRKYFDVDDVKFLFESIDLDLTSLTSLVLSTDKDCPPENYKALEGYLGLVKEILAIIVDQPFMTHFKANGQVLRVIYNAKKATTILAALGVAEALLDANTRLGSSSRPQILTLETKMGLLKYMSLISAGFNVFADNYVTLADVALKKVDLHAICGRARVKDPQDCFSTVVLDIDSLLTLWQSNAECKAQIYEFLKGNLGDFQEPLKGIYTDSLLWRCHLANLVKRNDLNSIEDIFILILKVRSQMGGSSQSSQADRQLSLIKEVVSTPQSADPLEEMTEILKLPVSSALHAAAIKSYFESQTHSETLGQRAKLLSDLLADFNHDTLRRRSSGTAFQGIGMDIEKDRGTVSKDSELLKVDGHHQGSFDSDQGYAPIHKHARRVHQREVQLRRADYQHLRQITKFSR